MNSRRLSLARAAELLALGRPADALLDIGPVLARDPEDRDALRIAGSALLQLGDWAEAGRMAARLVASDPTDESAEMLLIRTMWAGGNPHGASRAAAHLVRRRPDSVEALILQAHVATHPYNGRPSREALRAARRAVSLAPEDPRTHGALGDVHIRSRHRTRARDAFRRALELDPMSDEARVDLTLVDRSSLDPVGASRELARLAASSPFREDLIRVASWRLATGVWLVALVSTLASALSAWLLADPMAAVLRWPAVLVGAGIPAAAVVSARLRLGRSARPLLIEVASRYPGTVLGAAITASTGMLWVVAALDPASGAHWYRWAILVGLTGAAVSWLSLVLFHGRRHVGT